MDEQTTQNSYADFAEKILPQLPYPEKFTVADIEQVLRLEQQYLHDLNCSTGFEGPVDLLIKPHHELSSLAMACFLRGLPADEEDLFFIMDIKYTLIKNDGEISSDVDEYDFN